MKTVFCFRQSILAAFALWFCLGAMPAVADDWPQWRGPERDGVWREDGIVEEFPAEGLDFVWRVPIEGGYAGPAVADGRVFVTDFRPGEGMDGTERLHALDEQTGESLWTHSWDVNTRGIQMKYANGPRATPTVDGDRVYVLGSMGDLYCLNVENGEVVWHLNYVDRYDAYLPIWGMTSAPMVEDDLLIALVGGKPEKMIVAFDKMTGEEKWSALPPTGTAGYSSPIVVEAGGTRQLIAFYPTGISSLDPATGKVYWTHPYEVSMGQTVATPVVEGDMLFLTSRSSGASMFRLGNGGEGLPTAEVVWQNDGAAEKADDGIYGFLCTPHFFEGTIYGVGDRGVLRAVDAKTGERLWATHEATEEARGAEAFLVRNGDRFFINNDRGELILARLTPEGYEELSRAKLVEPTNDNYVGGRREFGAVNWTHPAYANGHIVHRNDKEIVRASLKKN